MLRPNTLFNNYSQSKETHNVFLRLHNGNGCSLNVSKFITLAELKAKISQAQIETPLSYQLVFKGKKLTKLDQPLCNAGVTDRSIIHIDNSYVISPNKLKLDVCFFYHGEKIVIRASRDQSILELKTKIYRLIGVLPRHQKIIFQGSKLEDKQPLSLYHIGQNSLICLYTNGMGEQEKTEFETPFKQNRQLISATTSVSFRKEPSKKGHINMFRSESMGAQKEAFQVEIKQDSRQELLGSKDFQFQLLTPFSLANIGQLQQNMPDLSHLSSESDCSEMQFKILVNQQQTHKLNIKLPVN